MYKAVYLSLCTNYHSHFTLPLPSRDDETKASRLTEQLLKGDNQFITGQYSIVTGLYTVLTV